MTSGGLDQRPVAKLEDGTPCFGRLGEFSRDEAQQRVQCHLCGAWFRALPAHLRLVHGWSAADYRLAFGLLATRPLQAKELSERQAVRWRERMGQDQRIRSGMKVGLALARGELNTMGRERDVEFGRALERQRDTRRSGERVGRLRAERLRAQREGLARQLGFSDLEAMLRDGYGRGGLTVAELAERLGCAEITVTGDMERLGVPRRPRDESLALGRLALARQRAAKRSDAEGRARALGFSSLTDYLVDRHHHRRWRHADIGRELDVTATGAVRKLLDAAGVRSLRASVPAGADAAAYHAERLVAAREALAERRRREERDLAVGLDVRDLDEWYAAGLARGESHRALARELGVSEKWLRVVRRRRG